MNVYVHSYSFTFMLVSWMVKREQARIFQDDFTWRKFRLNSIDDDGNDDGIYLSINHLSGETAIGKDFVSCYHDMKGGLLCDEPGE